MQVHLVDGTYELFRHYFAVPPSADSRGNEVGALVGVLNSVFMLLRDGATHVGVATDHVIESFRNNMWAGYKTGEGIEPELLAQFHPLEDALAAMGVTVWPMVELEADDGMASAATLAARDDRAERIFLCTPDKDLAQCVAGERIVQFDRRKREIRNAAGVYDKFGVAPASIPDWLALVGDSADGFPGLRGWGARSSAVVLDHYGHLEDIPADAAAWEVPVRGAERLAATLAEEREHAFLFRDLATLRRDAPLFERVDDIAWNGPAPDFESVCAHLGADGLFRRVADLAAQRGPAGGV